MHLTTTTTVTLAISQQVGQDNKDKKFSVDRFKQDCCKGM